MQPTALALGSLLLVLPLALPTAAETEVSGCQLNPAGSLVVLDGDSLAGEVLRLGIDNPLGTQSPGSATLLMVSLPLATQPPCGLPLPGFGMAGGGAPGELLVNVFLAGSLTATGPPWQGPGIPAAVDLAIPVNPNLLGLELAAQGAILDPSAGGGSGVAVGLTEGLRLVIEPGCGGVSPCVDISSVARLARGTTYGYDWDYDDGLESVLSNATPVSPWSGAAQAHQVDWWGYPVADADALHDSQLSGREISCDFALQVTTFGNHFSEDGGAYGDLQVGFAVTERVRFAAQATAQMSYGYGESRVKVDGPGGVVFSVGAYQGVGDTDQASGWLQVGDYGVDAHGVALAFGNTSFSETQTADLDFALTIHHAADWDLDGDVEADDASGFHAALQTGSLAADVDGDGDADAADGIAFDAAWNVAQDS